MLRFRAGASACILAAACAGADATSRAAVALPSPIGPIPSERQRAWQELEFCAFVHFNMNTFTDAEWGTGREDPAVFLPTALDCRQWARVCKDAGMKGVILTAKHHDGFCLWPTKLTKHSVASSPWREGKGDVVAELAKACAENGLKLGIYLSPWDRNSSIYGDSPSYNEYYKSQLAELLSGYGEIFEVWFDGACGEGPNGKKQVYDWPAYVDVVRRLQPNAVIFSDAGPDVRWVGNERGFAGETCWSTLRRDEFYPGTPNSNDLPTGHADGSHWVPAECDVSIRPGWFYHASQDAEVKSVAQLLEIYESSVGRNASLLLNLPVDRRGLVHERDVARLHELRASIDAIYSRDLARGASAASTAVRGSDPRFAPSRAIDGDPSTYWATADGASFAAISLQLAAPASFDRVQLREPIELGQRIERFSVDAWVAGAWVRVADGTTIGRRRILRVPRVETSQLRLTIHAAKACPALSEIALFSTPLGSPR